jgi:hypothetical protein
MGIFSWFRSRELADEPNWLRRMVMPRSYRRDPRLDEIKRAAAADVAEMEAEDRKYFRQDGPGKIEDDL